MLRDAVSAAGIRVVLHDDVFPPEPGVIVPDYRWLVEVGQRGWLLVTGDARTLKEDLFVRKIPESNAFVFILHDLNGGTAAERATCVIDAYPKMLGLIAPATRPEVWVFKRGTIKVAKWRETLERILRRDRKLASPTTAAHDIPPE